MCLISRVAVDYNNTTLQSSNLRPDVEPFVPKANHPPYFMVNGPGFSLDAPEFIPNVYPADGGIYTWFPNTNQYIMPSTTHPRYLIPRFRDKFLRQQQRSRGYGSQINGNIHRNYQESQYNDNNSMPPPHQPQQQLQQQQQPLPHKPYKVCTFCHHIINYILINLSKKLTDY